MPTRTFIGLVFLVIILMVASTPVILDPVAANVAKGLDAAGVPGLDPEAGQPKREQREDTGTVKDRLELKGYSAEDADMIDQIPEGHREVVNGRRLSVGSRRANLPGHVELDDRNTPILLSADGMLLDVNKCPVFRDGTDLAGLWADAAQKQRYLTKANAADNPAACKKALEARVAGSAVGGPDGPDGRVWSDIARSGDMGVYITRTYYELLETLFPDYENATLTRSTARDTLRGEPNS